MFICDSSFLIAFYSELDNEIPVPINVQKKDPSVEFHVTPLVKTEVSRKHHELFLNYNVFPIVFPKTNSVYEKTLAPFIEPFIGKGEREVIICSMENTKTPILDDKLPAKIWLKITGKEPMKTCNFIVKCSCKWDIISKEKAISMLNKLKRNGFRIKDEDLYLLKDSIKNC